MKFTSYRNRSQKEYFLVKFYLKEMSTKLIGDHLKSNRQTKLLNHFLII